MKLLAIDVQEMLDVPDYAVIAHGYTFGRNTVDIYFCNGSLMIDVDGLERGLSESSEYFEAAYFTRNIKRWYAGSFNKKLVDLFATFGLEVPYYGET